MGSEPVWIVFDGRGIYDTAEAGMLESFGLDVAKNDAQAIKYAKRDWRGHEFALYRYDLNAERVAENERLIHFQESP